MCRSTFLRALVVAVAMVLAASSGVASAAPAVEQFHDHFTDSFADEVCGIAVQTDLVVTDNFFVYADGSVKDASSVRATFTNPTNGKSIVLSNAGQFTSPASVVNEEAGTITFINSYKGLPEKIQLAQGPVLLRDAGLIAFADTFDLTTGEFLSEETIVNRGPHPEADSDFTAFCDVISGALM
jgi:hypothetical protein